MAESVHKRLERIRPPRVHISYEVEVGDAIEMKELPWVMGVLGEFTGHRDDLPKLKDRKFTEITPDNFDDVLARMNPTLNFTVDNKLSDDEDAGKFAVDLNFQSLDDFAPDKVAEQVEPLNKLLQLRRELADLRGRLQGNDKLEEILQASLTDDEKLSKLREELGSEESADGEEESDG